MRDTRASRTVRHSDTPPQHHPHFPASSPPLPHVFLPCFVHVPRPCLGRQVRPQCPGACACRGDGASRGPRRATGGGSGRPTAHTRHAAVRTQLKACNKAGTWDWGLTLLGVWLCGVQEPAGAECEASGACTARRRRRTTQGTARPGPHTPLVRSGHCSPCGMALVHASWAALIGACLCVLAADEHHGHGGGLRPGGDQHEPDPRRHPSQEHGGSYWGRRRHTQERTAGTAGEAGWL